MESGLESAKLLFSFICSPLTYSNPPSKAILHFKWRRSFWYRAKNWERCFRGVKCLRNAIKYLKGTKSIEDNPVLLYSCRSLESSGLKRPRSKFPALHRVVMQWYNVNGTDCFLHKGHSLVKISITADGKKSTPEHHHPWLGCTNFQKRLKTRLDITSQHHHNIYIICGLDISFE